ncbi:MAG: asparagine synthase-related protein [Candidatus Cloacimonetes bacterium]|nr:asparagine synthase-related protein [Candidatus Cloacimonadota bacterium]
MMLKNDSWQSIANIHFRGYIYDEGGNPAKLSELNRRFGNSKGIAEIEEQLKQANGCFALIIQNKNFTIAAVDRIRSIPLFFDANNRIADAANDLYKLDIQSIKDTSPEILNEFLITGFVSGAQTLHPKIQQIPAGYYLLLENGKEPQLKMYYGYFHKRELDDSEEALRAKLHQVHLNITERLINNLAGRAAVIPLSGGYDSRLIAYLLKRANYPAIYTFTYDAVNNPEAKISQKVAKHLNVPWLFVEHTYKSWNKAYFSNERMKHYQYAFNGVSSPHIQDWLAVKELRNNKLIPKNSVITPGHTADYLEGSRLPLCYREKTTFSDKDLIEQIIKRHYSLWKTQSMDDIAIYTKRIRNNIQIPESMNAQEAASLLEYWEVIERQAKFIVNSVRAYEDLGFSWCLPFWDAELMEFWSTIPLSLRVGRKLWHQYRHKYLPIPIPVFKYPNLPIRIRDKILRVMFGEIMDVRYGRFAEFRNPFQYASAKVSNYLRDEIEYPAYINPNKPLLRCHMNALQALRAIYEL